MLSDTLRARLRDGCTRESGFAVWGYGYRDGQGATEATALAALALGHGGSAEDRQLAAEAFGWLTPLQREDGGVPITDHLSEPCWPTALVLLAAAELDLVTELRARATDFLLHSQGVVSDPVPQFDHDPSIMGWSWVKGTSAWVEPTAYAVVALQQVGRAEHLRTREGVRMLLDRCLPATETHEGGWNYGNTRVLANMLRPFPAPTALSLLALGGRTETDPVARSLAYLARVGPELAAPVSLSWTTLALRRWGREVGACRRALARCVERPGRRPPDPVHDALMLLALAEPPPAFAAAPEPEPEIAPEIETGSSDE